MSLCLSFLIWKTGHDNNASLRGLWAVLAHSEGSVEEAMISALNAQELP